MRRTKNSILSSHDNFECLTWLVVTLYRCPTVHEEGREPDTCFLQQLLPLKVVTLYRCPTVHEEDREPDTCLLQQLLTLKVVTLYRCPTVHEEDRERHQYLMTFLNFTIRIQCY